MKIIKRNGSEAVFDITKIISAITKANKVVPEAQRLTKQQIIEISDHVQEVCYNRSHAMNVEEIQDLVEDAIMATGAYEVARRYITYRYVQSLKRTHNTTDDKILSLIECNNEEVKQENSNKNPTVNSVQRDYMAGEVSKDLTMRMLLPPEVVKAHEEGIIHFHDADYYAQHMHNCDLVNLDDMLQNGTVISGTLIEKPHSFSTACNIATQIIAQVASSQYGGQSISLTHLAPFVDISRKKIRRDVEAEMQDLGIDPGEEKLSEIVEKRLREEIKRGVQTIQYQVVTLMTTNGQAPFITVFMYLNEAGDNQRLKSDLAIVIEEMLRQRYQGVKNEAGVWITPAFPKLIYVLENDNIYEGQPYYYLTKLAAKCTAKRMVPDYISEKKMLEYKVDANGEGHCFTCMGCRSFLTPYLDENGKPKYYGRFNQGVVTINLVDVALSSGGDFDKFWQLFDERLELCHKALMCRHNRLKGTLSDAAPILWQYGALARLKKGEPIDKLLYGGYSTISLGYAGLYKDLDLDITPDALVGKISCEIETDSRVLQVTVTDTDPKRAKEIVDAIADVSAKQITSVMQIEGVNVIEYGRVANAPSSPNVKKNTMLGAIAGIVIAIAVLVVNFILDDRIKTSDDVEKYLGITNLSLIPLTEEEYNGQPSSKKKKTRK